MSFCHLLLAVTVLNVYLVFRTVRPKGNLSRKYSYIGKDYPFAYPMPIPLEAVALTLHESVHFALNGSDPEAQDEWRLLALIPQGAGRTRLGPDHRVFVLTITHQMHCLWGLQMGLVNRSDSIGSPGHFSHCLNYLRQTILCQSAESLENGDFTQHIDGDGEQPGTSLVCQDWEKVYSFFDDKNGEWEALRRDLGI